MIRLTYVSISCLPEDDADEILDTIVSRSGIANKQRNVTGILVSTGKHFAQMIEGPAADIADLSARIARDPRHRCFTVIDEEPIRDRSTGEWLLGYSGRSTYFCDIVARCLTEPGPARAAAISVLLQLIVELEECAIP